MYNVDNCSFQCSKMCMWWSTLALGFWWPSLKDTGTPQSALTSSWRPSARNGPSSSGPPSPETGESASWSESFYIGQGRVGSTELCQGSQDTNKECNLFPFRISLLYYVLWTFPSQVEITNCQRNVASFRPMLDDYRLWAEGELYPATPVVTRETMLFHDHPDYLSWQAMGTGNLFLN